jgi:branched-chain amino acid transport system substrate-binding protein
MRGFGRLAWLATALAAGWWNGALAAEPIRVGVTLAPTVAGNAVKDGLEAAQKILNDAGGIFGRPIELVVRDTQGIPEKTAAAIEALISKDHVAAILGEDENATALAGIEIAHRHHVPYLNINGGAAAIRAKGYREIFNPGIADGQVGAAVATALKALGAVSVVVFTDNSEDGAEQAKAIGARLKATAPEIRYSAVTFNRAAQDFAAATAPLRKDLPDVFVNLMQPPAAYPMINQVYEDGIAPSGKTYFYDAAGLAESPDFWEKVTDAGKGLVELGGYHPMRMPPLGKQVADAYAAKTGNAPNRLLFEAADALLVLADAIKRAGSTETDPVIRALEATNFPGTRGAITFSKEAGENFHQWLETPFVTYQLTEEDQKIADAPIIAAPGMAFDKTKVWKSTTY